MPLLTEIPRFSPGLPGGHFHHKCLSRNCIIWRRGRLSIDGDLQQRLYDKSPANVMRLILNKDEPGDDELNNRYTRAAKRMRFEVIGDTQYPGASRLRELLVLESEIVADAQSLTEAPEPRGEVVPA